MPVGNVTTFEPLPASTYLLRVNGVTEQKARESGNIFHSWTFEVMNDCVELGRTVNLAMPASMTPKSKLEQIWLACGLAELQVGENFNTDEALGAEIYIRLGVEANKAPRTGSKNVIQAVWSVEQYEAEIAQASRRPATRTGAAPQRPSQAPAPPVEESASPAEEGDGTEEVPQAPVTARPAAPAAARPAAHVASAARPATGKPLQFPKSNSLQK